MAKKKIFLIAGAVIMGVTAYHLGIFETFASASSVKEKLLDLGPLGYLAFLAAFTFLQPFGLPGVIFIVAASLVWAPAIAALLSMIGATLASVSGFSFARYIGRDWVEKKLPPRFRKYDERLAERGFATVFCLRAVLWTSPALHFLFGISRVRFSTHVAASVLAYTPLILIISYCGGSVFDTLKAQPRDRLVAAAVGLAIAALIAWALRRVKAGRSRPASAHTP